MPYVATLLPAPVRFLQPFSKSGPAAGCGEFREVVFHSGIIVSKVSIVRSIVVPGFVS